MFNNLPEPLQGFLLLILLLAVSVITVAISKFVAFYILKLKKQPPAPAVKKPAPIKKAHKRPTRSITIDPDSVDRIFVGKREV